MPSGKRAKEQRRQAAAAPPPVRSKAGAGTRQASPMVLAIAGGGVVLVVVAIVLAVVLSGKSTISGQGDGEHIAIATGTPTVGNSSSPSALPGASDVTKLLKGIPQSGFALGSPNAPVTLTEFIDLQCPDCDQFETTEFAPLVDKYVRTGKLKIKMEPWSILDRTADVHDSDRGQKATIAAAAQNKAFNFAQVLYDNQGTEDSGWMNDAMISNIAASVDGLHPYQLGTDANSSDTATLVHQIDTVANQLQTKWPPTQTTGFNGTPGLFLSKGNGAPQLFQNVAGVPDLSALEQAIDLLAK